MLDSTDRHLPHPHRLPNQRWEIAPDRPKLAEQMAAITGLPLLLARVLINRGIETPAEAQIFLNPESQVLPLPIDEFPDLAISVQLLREAIASHHKIAICGDYDADGMTSTALLLRALRWLGASVDYAIPSRMSEGYGINRRIVEEFHSEGVQLILTVDNGISAYDPVDRARQLGLKVIITDHHDIPEKLPPADAILNPKLIRENSPYRGVAGVGVAYILAISLAQELGKMQGLITPLRELMTLGTIADLAPLTGVNRRWVKKGLQQLPHSKLAGVQALIQVAGVGGDSPTSKALKPEDIGFRLGPRINAVGRIGDPQIAIELLSTDDMGVALERAMQCEQINERRQQLCAEIEEEAIAWVESSQINFQDKRVLVVVQPNWHHGVIGIVASRLLERYGVPVFIGTYEDDGHIRGSARGIPEFHVFEALQFCDDLLGKYGGHRAAGGFSLPAKNLEAFSDRLSQFANQCLEIAHLKPIVKIDAPADFHEIDLNLYQQIDALQPCGIENRAPVFWTTNVRVIEQKIVGKGHIKFTLSQDSGTARSNIKAIAWRWGDYFPLPSRIDVAYQLKENTWNGNTTIELELLGVRLPLTETEPQKSPIVGAGLAENPSLPQTNSQQKSPVVGAGLAENPSLPQTNSQQNPPLQLVYPEAPIIEVIPEWCNGGIIDELLYDLRGRVLLYGDGKPTVQPGTTRGEIVCDRPAGKCDRFVLWTLPPSITHLKWLLAISQPKQVYVCNQIPVLPDAQELRSLLQTYLKTSPSLLNLLQLGQQWWVAPCTLVAALRELGYPCRDFGNTYSLDRELQRLHGWYSYPAAKLAQLNWV